MFLSNTKREVVNFQNRVLVLNHQFMVINSKYHNQVLASITKENKSTHITVDKRSNYEPEYTLQFNTTQFKTVWPLYLYPCQTTDKFEVMFGIIPKLHLSRNYSLGQQT